MSYREHAQQETRDIIDRLGNVPDVMTVTVDSSPHLKAHGHHLFSSYAERFWLPTIGPSSFLLLRRLNHERMDQQRSFFTIERDYLARSVGLGAGQTRIRQVLKRLAIFRLVDLDHLGFHFPTYLPALHRGQVARLHNMIAAEHQTHYAVPVEELVRT